ncbi:sigma-54-dependent Fis family transcriptional regulator, partial [Planctomycetota bacterium]
TSSRARTELRKAKQRALARLERSFLAAVLERGGGQVALAARLADMNRAQLHHLMSRHGVSAADFKRDA